MVVTANKLYFSVLLTCFVIPRHVISSCDGEPNTCPMPEHCTCTTHGSGINMTCERSQQSSGSGLTSVPPHLPANLVKLKINRHWVRRIRVSDFSKCTALEILYLEHNNISSIIKGAFADSPKLRILCVNRNNISFSQLDSFPLHLLDNLHNITQLWIDQNHWGRLTTYRDDLFVNKPHLEQLAMDGIEGAVFPSTNAPSNITDLLIYQGVRTLTPDTFKNWTGFPLKKLHLICLHNPVHELTCLKMIKPGACSVFPTLDELDLSYNEDLGFDNSSGLQQCLHDLQATSITKLILNSIVKNPTSTTRSLSKDFLQPLKQLNLRVLKLEGNGLTGIKGPWTLNDIIPQIQTLSLAYNRFFGFDMNILRRAYNLKELVSLDMKCQTRLYNPPHPDITLEQTHLTSSAQPVRVIFPPKIKVISLSDAFDEGDLEFGDVILKNIPNVSVVDMSRNKVNKLAGKLIVSPEDRRPHIHVLNLSECGIQYLNVTFFSSTVRIHTLDLSQNIYLGEQLKDDTNGTLMASLDQADVRVLNLSLTNIKYIPFKFFSTIRTLEEIVLRNTAIGSFYCDLKHMSQLKFLDLSENNFMYLLPVLMRGIEEVARLHRVTVDLTGNPLEVECNNLNFLLWVIHARSVKLRNKESLKFYLRCPDGCYKVYNISLLTDEVKKLTLNCHSETWVVVSGSFIGVAMVLICIIAIVHRQRWDIRYFCLRLVRQRRAYEQLENSREYHYDAFIVYHNKDIAWVKHQMIPKLEQDTSLPLKLCIHERDWIPGHTIEDNICSSVQDSRKTVFLLTRRSLASKWCEFEIQMARMRSIDEGKDVIIVVALEEIPVSEMHNTLVNLRRSSTWLEWDPDNREEQAVFWQRLREAIRHPSEKPSRCACGRTFYPDGTSDHHP